ncbi:unnamed protein product [Spirodela intermedia]|uniref:RRM domain-containing protein n=1 Tax=Spirodela intermedia TaxID=51605 RepID=A0A7I8ICG1_SPIIN|nr:unnamed protein product [Spirodela intermedia]CAA6655329.1 unnamed protein product [Spirodela intermedia]
MDSDQGKLFIGGYRGKQRRISCGSTSANLGTAPGFGFVVFADPTLVDRVLQDKHTIDGRIVEAKRAMSREEQHTSSKSGNPASGRAMGGSGGGSQKTKKIFVGGLPPTLSEEGFRKYFEAYGTVTDVVVMYDQNTQRPRGFGFISFDSEEAVDQVLHKTFHDLSGKLVEVKRAMPKDALSHGSGGGRSVGGGGGGYQTYAGSNPSSGSYEGRMDANRYMPPQTGGGFPPYGSSGYGAPGYGYGAANNGVGYGGFGVGGYGGAGAGYSGPGGAYGNPNAPTGGYVGGPPGGPRSPWSNQVPSGYGSAGYGASAGYGSGASWNAPGGGGGVPPTGQSPSGAGGYGNQGYGYGGYGGGEYISRGGGTAPAGGAVGDQHGAGSGYMGGGYGDGSGGYPSSWKSDPSQGGVYGAGQAGGPLGASGYGGYGGAQPRQAQQQ